MALKTEAGSPDLAPRLTVGQINLYGDKQTNNQVYGNIIRYGIIGSPARLELNPGASYTGWEKLTAGAKYRCSASKDGHPND